jgi:hypothetical protein
MNQTADIAQKLVNDPPAELQQLMNDPRTSDSARAAVSDVASVTSPLKVNGGSIGPVETTGEGGDGRLQVVNEVQEFT